MREAKPDNNRDSFECGRGRDRNRRNGTKAGNYIALLKRVCLSGSCTSDDGSRLCQHRRAGQPEIVLRPGFLDKSNTHSYIPALAPLTSGRFWSFCSRGRE